MALDYFQKALKVALDKDNKLDMCYAIYGIASCYYTDGKLEEALKELYNLEVFFGALQVPDSKSAHVCLTALSIATGVNTIALSNVSGKATKC